MKLELTRFQGSWASALTLLVVVSASWLATVAALESLLSGTGFVAHMLTIDADTAEAILGSFPEVIVAVLGITITVVSITLQLAATRYTHRVTEMFFHDKGNLGVLSFYVVASIHCIIAAALVRHGTIPPVLLVSTLLIVVVTVLLLIPYFIYVFAFLDPARLVGRLKHQSINAFLRQEATASSAQLNAAQAEFREAVEQLSDVAIHAISERDRGIASLTSEALTSIATAYLGKKSSMAPGWFQIGESIRHFPELEILAEESVRKLERDHCWLEWMVLRQMTTIYQESLNRMRDVARLVSINTRQLAEQALRTQDTAVLDLSIRYFNSYLRAAINLRDVRSAYNVLDQYRNLAESAMADRKPEVVIRISENFGYYGRVANHAGLSFVTESAAFDLEALCEVAHRAGCVNQMAILESLLSIDEKPESREEESSLRGVRKAQIKLATYYLSAGADDLACLIVDDMVDEKPQRLERLREELVAATQPEFWEVIDRGKNFDFLEPPLRAQVERFFELLDERRKAP